METLAVRGEDYQNGQIGRQYISGPVRGTITNRIQVDAAGTHIIVEIDTDSDFGIITTRHSTKQPAIKQRFRTLADQWRKETRYLSSATKKIMHPAYQQIIGMGRDALPLIMEELRRTRGHWLWALFAITGEDPAPEGCTFSEAVDAWLSWGIHHGYATPD